MRPFSVENLSVFALIVPIITALNAPPQQQQQQGATLRPINIFDYESSKGLQRRDSNDLSVLDPQGQSELVYGGSGDNGQFLLANMTLYAQDGLPIVLPERFEELSVSVNCHDDEGTLSMTFASMDAFDYAKTRWGYVNKADDGKFLLIANKDGCGPDDQRQPYIVSNITEDDVTLTIALAAQGVPWSQVAGSYELQFGHAMPIPHAHRLKRGIWAEAENAGDDVENAGEDVENAGKNVLNATEGNFNKSKSASYSINTGHQNQRTTIYTDFEAGLTIDCTNCFVAGSLEVTGYILVQDFEFQDLILTASPDSIFAALELEASMTASYGSDSLGYTKDLFSQGIPGIGISIPEIMNIGATLTYSVGGNCSFSGSATVGFGLQATIPDSAQIVADYHNRGASTATGFSKGELTPIFGVPNEAVSVTLSALSQLKIDFGVDLLDFGTVDVGLAVKLPEVSATLTAKYDEQGACSQEAGAFKTGIEVDSTVNIEIDLIMDAKLGDEGNSWSKPLFSDSIPLYSHCYPLDIPGHLSTSNATRTSTLPSTISGSAYPSGSSSFTPFLGLGRRWAQNSSSVASLPTGYPSRRGPQTSSSSPSEQPTSESLSSLGKELIGELDKIFRPSGAGSSSTLSSTTSTNLETNSMSTPAKSPTSSKFGVSSTLSSSASKSSEITSLSTSPVSLRTESMSSVSSTSSLSPKISLTTTLSSPTVESSTTSSLTNISKSSRSVSSPTTSSSTSKSYETNSKPILATSAKSSQIGPSSTPSSKAPSLSATELSSSTKTNTATKGPSQISSRSTSEGPTSTLAPTSLLPDHESQTAIKESKATSPTAIPSFTALFQVITTVTSLPHPTDKNTLRVSSSPTKGVDESFTVSTSSISTSTTSTSTTSTSTTSTSTTSTSTTSTSTTSTSTTSSPLPAKNTHTAVDHPNATATAGKSSKKGLQAHSPDTDDGNSASSAHGSSHHAHCC